MLLTSSECVTWLAVKLLESVAIVMLNVVTIIIFIKGQRLRRRITYLIINLAVADMLVGGFTVVMDFIYFAGKLCNVWKYDVSRIWQLVVLGIQFLFHSSSITNIAAISLERMYATFCPNRHRVIKKWIDVVTLVLVWVLATVVSTAMIILFLYGKVLSHSLYLWQSFNSLCLLVICVSYSSIAVKICRGGHPQHHCAARKERQLTVTLFIMTLVSLLMYLPFVIINFLNTINTLEDVSDLTQLRVNNALFMLCSINSLLNPILYALRIPGFKRDLASLFRCRRQQRQVAPLGAM